jgi:hypothetical protein
MPVTLSDDQITQLTQVAERQQAELTRLATLEQEQQQAIERNEKANAQTLRDIDARGQKKYGEEAWNSAMQTFRREERDIKGYEEQLAVHPKYAHDHAMRMATDKDYRKQFTNASVERRHGMIMEHARNNSPYGSVNDVPPPKDDAEFRRTGGAGVDDDREWSRTFDRIHGIRRR